jgi:uncharacterized protein (DUF362 family)/Pyruvate/2-oxoacid:ferredoxin oxidoreductase delta subunit
MRAFVRPGERTLLKVNLVSPHEEAAAVTTHAALVAALVDEVRAAGGLPFVGDSPALVTAGAVARRSGLRAVCAARDAPIVDLGDPEVVLSPGARLARAFQLSKKLRSFDAVVNVPKLKTHCFQGMTGAVKNLFGVIPGKLKTAHHLTHTDPLAFAETLLDLHDTIRPRLTVVDAVMGMEGPGPGSGTPRPFNLVLAGADAVAVDAVCARFMGFSEREVPTLWQASKRGLAQAEVRHVEVIGERLGDVLVDRLQKPRASATTYVPGFAMALCKKMLTARPVLRSERCGGCGACFQMCAAEAITMVGRTPRFDDACCIRCYCCHEICPSAAIDLRAGILARFLDGRSS